MERPDITCDSDLIGELLAHEYPVDGDPEGRELETALSAVLPSLEGAFSLVLMDDRHLVAVRDPHGFRPLVLGRIEKGWVVASETAALDIVGARFVREVEPGEMVVVDEAGLRSHALGRARRRRCACSSSCTSPGPTPCCTGRRSTPPASAWGRRWPARRRVPADMVMPVPESGIPAAQGFARQIGIPYGDGLVKNRYVGRTFISPTQTMRGTGVRVKLNPLVENIRGKRLVVVDDSIVRGTTTRQIVNMLRESGAREVHLRISSPPYRWPCFYGMDTSRRSELLAADLSVGEIRDYLGVDSLAYLELDRLVRATGGADGSFCTACLTGRYPVAIPDGLDKAVLEVSSAPPR